MFRDLVFVSALMVAAASGCSGDPGTTSGTGTGTGSEALGSGDGRTGGGPLGTSDQLSDPSCEGLELPPCPAACEPGAFQSCGQPCAAEGDACGNAIGDGMSCSDGIWQCFVHPPAGEGCNLVCRDDAA